MPNKLTNNPVTPSDEMLELLKDWVAPDVTEVKKKELQGKTNFMGVPINELYSSKKVDVALENEEIPQLTAEEIEQIRQDAYDEGFSQGKADGHQVGYEEGKNLGIEEGQQLGLEQGKEQGLSEGQALIEQQAREWQGLISQLYDPIKRVDKAVEMQLLELAVSLAEAVIRTETTSNKEVLLNILHESIASLPFNTEYIELHMHPDDIETLKSVYDEDALIEHKWIIKEEPGYQQGDLVVGTPNSLIDRTLKHRLKQTIGEFVKSAGLNKEHAASPIPLDNDLTVGINKDPSGVDETVINDDNHVEGNDAEGQTASTQTEGQANEPNLEAVDPQSAAVTSDKIDESGQAAQPDEMTSDNVNAEETPKPAAENDEGTNL